MITNLEEDAKGIVKFMASNGLVANPSKTEFMLINKEKGAEQDSPSKIRVGQAEITEAQSAKLLGITMDNNL